jgi:predicted Zn-dependent peptidase
MAKKTTLENGLRIITIPDKSSLTTTALILVEAGSKYETKDINGISHFLEHMCFKGTEKRPKSIDISSELDGIGAAYNAFTSMEYTGYYAKAANKHFEKILDVVSDIYLNQLFEQKEIEKERGVIIEEINMYEDLPMRRVQEIFTSLLYGDRPAGWSIAGEKEVVRNLRRENFIDYRDRHYLAQSSIVVLSGNFDENEAIKQTEKLFSSVKTGRKSPKEKVEERQSAPAVLLKSKQTDQSHIVLGVRTCDSLDPRRYAFSLISEILGGGMSSRLFQKIREEMGAAYYVRCESDLYTDHGYLSVSAGVEHAKAKDVAKAVLEEFKRISEEPVEEKELKRAKEHLVGNLVMELESSDEIAAFHGMQEILSKKLMEPEELIAKIQAVKSEEILEAAKFAFRNEKLNLAGIGPFKEEDEKGFENLLSL